AANALPAPEVTAAARVERTRHAKEGGASPRPTPAPRPEASEGDLAAKTIRTSLVEAVAPFDRTLEPAARLDLPSVHPESRRGPERLNLGPGTFRVRREPMRTVIDLAPAGEGAGGQRLTFRVIVPQPESEQQEIVADVDGGPIGLAALGVRDGDMGLLRV